MAADAAPRRLPQYIRRMLLQGALHRTQPRRASLLTESSSSVRLKGLGVAATAALPPPRRRPGPERDASGKRSVKPATAHSKPEGALKGVRQYHRYTSGGDREIEP